ncbi:MAG: BatA domain-containing protein [Planctomycetota bacterium]|nr:BatA domain-containing protein [Planctomycetota bacterium]
MTFAHAWALYALFPLALAALVLLQLYRARRRELVAGSLMLWQRVASQTAAPPRRTLPLDLAFWLQVLILFLLCLALADGAWTATSAPGRRVALLVDNGPSARARKGDGRPVWTDVASAAREILERLGPDDRVALLASAPLPRLLSPEEGLAPADVRAKLDALAPALSSPDADECARALLEEARVFGVAGTPAAALACSPRAAPALVQSLAHAAWRTVGPGPGLPNVALTAVGSEVVPSAAPAEKTAEAEVLVQVRNFGPVEAAGRVRLESLDPRRDLRDERALKLGAAGAPGAIAGVAFRVTGPEFPPLRLAWHPDGAPDALPEDDALTAAPRPVTRPSVRFFGEAPEVAALFEHGLHAERLKPGDARVADLAVFVDRVPAESAEEAARAVLLLAPPAAYGAFEVGEELLKRPKVLAGDPDELTRGFEAGAQGLDLPIAEARSLQPVGDVKPLLRDASGRLLAGRFRLAGARMGYVLAWAPGEELRKREQHLPLAALLIRLLREAQGAREPYAVEPLAARERAGGTPSAADWSAGLEPGAAAGVGVLDPSASALALGEPVSGAPDLAALLPEGRPETALLWPYAAALALLALLFELLRERRPQEPAGSAVPLPRAEPARRETASV